MNASDMLDYALGRLESPARDQADHEIASDPALAETLDRLDRALHQLLDDGQEALEPSNGLAQRTVARLVESRRPRRRSFHDLLPVTVPFRWADVAVAAGILLASLLTLLPAVQCSRQRMSQAGCGFNLQQLGISLAQYAVQHRAYPYAPPDHPDAVSGCFAVLLHEEGLLPDLTTLDCPSNGTLHPASKLPSIKSLCEIQHKQPSRIPHLLCCDYAYNISCRNKSGRPGAIPARLSSALPLLADQPPHEGFRILEGNSPNHAARGQNILYSDGHVHWHFTRCVGPDDADLFLNADQKPEPGANLHDAVLVPGYFPFVR